MRLVCVAAILVATISANLLRTGPLHQFEHVMPLLAVAIWGTICVFSFVRKPTWSLVPGLAKSASFLLMLVFCASLMPLEKLPEPSALSAFAIGGLSSVFDNIPLTSLALNQGGYDWSLMAFAVGVGGSMLWFGSSAGVALCTRFPEGRSAVNWLRHGWHVPVGYVLGFWTIFLVHGWEPDPAHPGMNRPPVVEEPTDTEEPAQGDVLNIGVQSGAPDASGSKALSLRVTPARPGSSGPSSFSKASPRAPSRWASGREHRPSGCERVHAHGVGSAARPVRVGAPRSSAGVGTNAYRAAPPTSLRRVRAHSAPRVLGAARRRARAAV
jgi:hypothetical protein